MCICVSCCVCFSIDYFPYGGFFVYFLGDVGLIFLNSVWFVDPSSVGVYDCVWWFIVGVLCVIVSLNDSYGRVHDMRCYIPEVPGARTYSIMHLLQFLYLRLRAPA